MATFLASLDGTIIATALPKIASDFSANKEMSWVATAYLLTFSTLPQVEFKLFLQLSRCRMRSDYFALIDRTRDLCFDSFFFFLIGHRE